jgi:hypothetical protein
LSGQSLMQAAQGLANAQTQGPLAELQKQIAANNAQTQGTAKLTGGFYNQLEPFVQQGAANSGNIASGLNSQLQGIGNDTQTQLASQGQNALSSLMKYAPQGEGGIANAATSDLAAQIARQQGLAAQQAGTYRSLGANQGANYQQMTNSQLGTYGLQGQEALKNIAQSGTVKNEPLVSKIAALQAQKGALTATDLGKLRQQEVANQISRAGLGIKQQSLQATVSNNNARNALTTRAQNIALNGQQLAQMRSDRTYQLDVQKFGAGQAKDAYLRSHGLGAYRVPTGAKLPATTPTGQRTQTPAQQQKAFGQIDTLRQLITDAQRPLSQKDATALGMKPGQRLTEQQIRGLLADGRNPARTRFDPALVDSAYALNGWGYLTNKQITELNKLGLIIGNRYRRGAAPSAPNYSGAQYNSKPPTSAANAQVPGF